MMWMKQELDRAMADVRLSGARKAAILRAAREEERPRAVRFPKRVAVLAAVLIACLTVTAAAVSLDWFTLFHEWMGGFDEAYQPQEGAVYDQGIEMQMVGVLYDSTQLEILLAIKDLEGGRLDENISVRENMSAFVKGGYGSLQNEFLEYREAENTVLYRIRYEISEPCNIEDTALRVWEIRHEKKIEGCSFTLDDPPIGEILPGTDGIRLLSAGFEEDDLLHIRLEVPGDAENYDCIRAEAIHENIPSCVLVRSDGNVVEQVFDGFTPADWEEIQGIQISGSYYDEVIEGDWELPLDVGSPNEWVCYPEHMKVNRDFMESISVSSLAVRISTFQEGDDVASLGDSVITVRFKDGTEKTISRMNLKRRSENWANERNRSAIVYIWTFDEVIDPAEVEAVILQGITFKP